MLQYDAWLYWYALFFIYNMQSVVRYYAYSCLHKAIPISNEWRPCMKKLNLLKLLSCIAIELPRFERRLASSHLQSWTALRAQLVTLCDICHKLDTHSVVLSFTPCVLCIFSGINIQSRETLWQCYSAQQLLWINYQPSCCCLLARVSVPGFTWGSRCSEYESPFRLKGRIRWKLRLMKTCTHRNSKLRDKS